MARSSRHPREVRERAVALVWETQSDYGSQWESIVSISGKVGVSVAHHITEEDGITTVQVAARSLTKTPPGMSRPSTRNRKILVETSLLGIR